MNNRMIKFSAPLFAGTLFAGMFLILSYTMAFDLFVMGEPISSEECKSDFWSQTCCWTDNSGGTIHKECRTCISDGYGGYTINCQITKGPVAKPDDPYAPTPDRPFGGIFKIPTPGTAAQDISQPETTGTRQGGILQGDPVVGGGTAVQDTPLQPETSGPQQGGILGNWGLLKTNQDDETTSEDGLTEESPATEEIQPVLVQDEPVPSCPEGQILDEETNLCVIEETEVDEQQEEQEQPQQEEAEEEPSSEKEDEN